MTASVLRGPAVEPDAIGGNSERTPVGVAAGPESDRFLRLLRACCPDSPINIQRHAWLIDRVLARLEERRNG